MEVKNAKDGKDGVLEQLYCSAQRPSRKRLDPALKSWQNIVIIPALVRDYLEEMEKQNRLATTGGSELLPTRTEKYDPALCRLCPLLQ